MYGCDLIAPTGIALELMCDASDFAIGGTNESIGQRKNKAFLKYSLCLCKTMNEAQKLIYTTTAQRILLAVVYAFEKLRSYLVMSKAIVLLLTILPLKYLFAKKDAKQDLCGALCSKNLRCVSGWAKKLLDILQAATVDHWGTLWCNYTEEKVFDSEILIGPPSTRMPYDLCPVVTFVNVKEKLRNVMRCHKTPSKFAKSLTSGALILWGRSRLQEGTSTYSWLLTTCQNGLKQKRSPPMMPELFANF
ncbi:reverse transcriptase domain-containing protein [Tanacetum coccineum]